ncbi:MAG: sugar phosphate isomerase/epimerase [bacterium]|nr:sugar phosphate isomerase/epimerase [bacterium]
MKVHRRSFLTATAAMAATANMPLRASAKPEAANPIAVFTKHVQSLSFDELGKRLNSIGVQGIEATLRPGGQIEPGELEQKLGGLCEALGKHGQQVLIAASNVNQVDSNSEAYLAQLSKHAIPYFRMDYYRYDFSQPILPQLDRFARQAQELAALCRANKVVALYQNHAGRNYVGAAVWDLLHVLSEVDPQGMAVALDIRHTTLELSQSYPAAYAAIRQRMGATYIKDFDWIDGQPVNVPLGQGRSKPLFDLIRRDGFVGPLSLHMEYTDHQDASQTEASWQAIAADVRTLKEWLGSEGN